MLVEFQDQSNVAFSKSISFLLLQIFISLVYNKLLTNGCSLYNSLQLQILNNHKLQKLLKIL